MDYRDEPLINVKSKETAYLEYSIYIFSNKKYTVAYFYFPCQESRFKDWKVEEG